MLLKLITRFLLAHPVKGQYHVESVGGGLKYVRVYNADYSYRTEVFLDGREASLICSLHNLRLPIRSNWAIVFPFQDALEQLHPDVYAE